MHIIAWIAYRMSNIGLFFSAACSTKLVGCIFSLLISKNWVPTPSKNLHLDSIPILKCLDYLGNERFYSKLSTQTLCHIKAETQNCISFIILCDYFTELEMKE